MPLLVNSQSANQKQDPETPLVDPEIGCVIKDEPTQSFYIKLKPSVIPAHWRNDPDSLSLDYHFNSVDEESNIPDMKSRFGLSNPIPIIRQEREGYWLIDGGDGKQYIWEYVADIFLEVYERDLAKILATFRQYWSLGGMTVRRLGLLDCGSADYSAQWICVTPKEPEIARLYRGKGHPALCSSPE